jgi:hypothetical protein
MTKKEMILAIQVAEARAWKELSELKKSLSTDDDIVKATRRGWRTLFELRESMNVPGLPVRQLIEMDLLAM